MKRYLKVGLLVLLSAASFFLARYQTDREFINLQPTPGADALLVLQSGQTYEQSFVVNQSTLTRLGFFFKPLVENLSRESVTVTLAQDTRPITEITIGTEFIDAQGFTQIRFNPPLQLAITAPVLATITVPQALAGKIGLQLRHRDETFNRSDVSLRIDDVLQEHVLAYQAYFRYRPALAQQTAALLLVGALLLFVPRQFASRVPLALGVLIPTIALLPVVGYSAFPFALLGAQIIAWLGMFLLLRHHNFAPAAALVGAHASSLTTYFALQLQGGRLSLLLLAAFPLLIWLCRRYTSYRSLWVAPLLIVVLSFYFLPTQEPVVTYAHPRDIFLDPYQVSSAEKISGSFVPWHHFGSYIGLPVAALSLLGAVTRASSYRALALLLLCALGTFYYLSRAPSTLLPNAVYGSIGLTYLLAFFAAAGLDALQRYVGFTSITRKIFMVIAFIVLLDLLFVLGNTLEFPHL